jgi:hypothetical protein
MFKMKPLQPALLDESMIPSNVDYVEIEVNEYVMVDKERGIIFTTPANLTTKAISQ